MIAGRQLTIDFASRLNEAVNVDPAFAAAACADAVLAMEALLKSQTNAKQESIEVACSTFATALYNGNTNYRCNIVYEEDN